ncbi:hypothetical protein ABFX02_02G113900 [Erythranthe guttata]
MASYSQTTFISSLLPINNNNKNKQPTNYLSFKNSRSRISSSKTEEESSQESKTQEQDPVKLAFAKAKAYKNSPKNDEIKDNKEVPLAVKIAMEKAKKYKNNKILEGGAVPNIVQNSGAEIELKKNGGEVESGKDDGGQGNIPSSIKLALEKANDYKKNKSGDEKLASGLKEGNENIPEVKKPIKSSSKKDKLSISNIDFVGLGFADKKSGRSLPAGLVPFSDPYPQGDIPEVEILVGNSSNFGNALAEPKPTPLQENDDDDQLYKPKVSTWGLFPRPNDISKAYGGGRTLRPGQALETAEERAAKEARTKQLLADYKKKYGLNIDPKLKSECEKALNDGDALMDLGELKKALPFYEEVMEKLPFQSEIHGLAALQWSICQDSRNRSDEARVMYEKLQSHPNPRVSKKARQFVFGFQAMEMMKVRSLNRKRLSTEYQNYFEAFVQNKTSYTPKESEVVDESGSNRALPYVFIFLASPIILVLLIAASRMH